MTGMAAIEQTKVICILLAALGCVSLARECIPVDGYESCACYMEGANNTREYVNLLPLKGNSRTPRFTSKTDNQWFISYSPCTEFSEFAGENRTARNTPCYNTSVARWTNSSAHQCDSLGDEAGGTFKMNVHDDFIKSNLTLNFTSVKTGYKAVISLICNDSLPHNESIFEYVGTRTTPTNTYFLSLTSRCCCPGKCGIPPAKTTVRTPTGSSSIKQSNGLKTWEIIVIVAGGVVLLLLIIGLVFCCRRKRGYQAV